MSTTEQRPPRLQCVVRPTTTRTPPRAVASRAVRFRPLAPPSPNRRASALQEAAGLLERRQSVGRESVLAQLTDYASEAVLPMKVVRTRDGAIVRTVEALGAVAFICDPACPPVLLTEHIIAALAAGNAIAIALLEPADAVLADVLEALVCALPEAVLVVTAATGNDWNGVPDDCRMVVLTRTRVHIDGTHTRPMRPRSSTPASRRSLVRFYSRTMQYTVPIVVVAHSPATATATWTRR